MSKRDFFILIIKLFGLTTIITTLFSVIPNNIGWAIANMNLFALAWIILAVLLTIGLFALLIFKADKVVQLLKLEQGFDDNRIELGSLAAYDIVKIGTFIIGGFLILDNIPAFLSHTLFAFKSSIAHHPYETKDNFYWAVSAINIMLGFVLIKNYSFVAKLLSRMSKNEL